MPIRPMLYCAAFWALAACVPQVQNFAQPRAAQDAPRGYARIFSPAAHAFRYTQGDEPVRLGRRAERFELQDGDCGGSDCTAPRYRSEIRMETNRSIARVGEDVWFGWSFHNGNIASAPKALSMKPVFGQWKTNGADPAVFRIVQIGKGEGNWTACDTRICERSRAAADVVVQLDAMRAASNWGTVQNFGYICKLFDMQDNRGKWVDIVVNTNFADDSTGYLRVWVNGGQRCDYEGPLVADGHTGPISHRRGIFASYTARWDRQKPGTPKPTMVAYYDEFIQGRSREDVDPKLREQLRRRAVD
ncbi:MAG: polysaccharide lyase [Rhodobacteraceae bacterium]|nr:polysaccharide lyase [Paracoccaceae bacterium]